MLMKCRADYIKITDSLIHLLCVQSLYHWLAIKGDFNYTEDFIDNDNNLNNNGSDDLSVSESSDRFTVTTDPNINGTEEMLTSESNLLRGESQSGLRGNAKGVDYKRNQFNREKGSHAREEINASKSKKVDTHDRRANNERALKEKTIIEFFERGL